MIKTVCIFELVSGGSVEWPSPIVGSFRDNFSRGVFSFDARSKPEAEFRKKLKESGLKVLRSKVLKVTGSNLYDFPFHYLSVNVDRPYDKGSFRDLSSGCPGGGGFTCRVGQTQIKKVTVDKDRSKKLDIMTDAGWPRPFVYLVSRRLRDLLVEQAFSGFNLLPCLRIGVHYSEKERSIDCLNDRLEDEATHFQLIVTGRTQGVPDVGEVARVSSECPRCQTINGGIFEFPRFNPRALADKDFQLVWEYNSTNRDRFGIRGEMLIVSKRVLRLLRENKVSGLGPYLTDPRIPHGVVDIRSE